MNYKSYIFKTCFQVLVNLEHIRQYLLLVTVFSATQAVTIFNVIRSPELQSPCSNYCNGPNRLLKYCISTNKRQVDICEIVRNRLLFRFGKFFLSFFRLTKIQSNQSIVPFHDAFQVTCRFTDGHSKSRSLQFFYGKQEIGSSET